MPKITIVTDEKEELFQLTTAKTDGPLTSFGDYATLVYGDQVYICRMMDANDLPAKVSLVKAWESHGDVIVEAGDLSEDDADEGEDEPENNVPLIIPITSNKIT